MKKSNTNKMHSQIEQLLEKNVGNCVSQALSLLLPSRFINQKSKNKTKVDFDWYGIISITWIKLSWF